MVQCMQNMSTMGTQARTLTDCICNAGYDGELCEPCSLGSFKNSSGNYDCRSCHAGSYADSLGRTVCTECMPANFKFLLIFASDNGGRAACNLWPLYSILGLLGICVVVFLIHMLAKFYRFRRQERIKSNIEAIADAAQDSRISAEIGMLHHQLFHTLKFGAKSRGRAKQSLQLRSYSGE